MITGTTPEELRKRVQELEAQVQSLQCQLETRQIPPGAAASLAESPSSPSSSNQIQVAGIDIAWDTHLGTCTFEQLPVAMLWIDTTLAGLMAGLQAMVGAERFGIALQSEGRKSVEADWQVIARYPDFQQGFQAISTIAAVAGWGEWRLVEIDTEQRHSRIRVWNSWEGRYQKALGVCWGSGMLAGKLAGYCSRLFGTNCWADQTRFLASGDEYDEFWVRPSLRTVEEEINQLLLTDQATRADMAVALQRLRQESAERQQAEERVRLLSRPLEAILDSANVWVEMRDENGRIVIWNQAAEELSGYTRDEVIDRGDTWTLLYPDADYRKTVMDRGGAGSADEAVAGTETTIRCRNGANRVIAWYARSLSMAANHPGGLLVLGLDITERKRVEAALLEEKERAQVTLHSIGDAVITTDPAGRIRYLNPVAEHLTGWPVAAAMGRPLPQVFHIIDEDTRRPASDPVARCLAEGRITGLSNHTILQSRAGQEYAIQDSAAPIRGPGGQVFGAVLVFSDITEARHLTKQIIHEAMHDALTGLVNRREFEKRLERTLASAKQHGTHHALCYLDLDQFKIINDTAGHTAGDELLKQLKGLLMGTFRERDTFARLGGDEFGLLLDNCPLDKARGIAENLIVSVSDYRFVWKGRRYQIGVSIGLVPITPAPTDATQLLSQADVACYIAKERGRNRVHVYQHDDNDSIQHHGEILQAAGLQDALEQERFCLYCQPIVPLVENREVPVRYELLLRLRDANGKLVLPGTFIPAAERYGLMDAIDRWVIRTAVRLAAQGRPAPDAQIAINLSGNSLNNQTLLTFVQAQFAEYSFPPERVCFEITETAAVYNLSQAREFISAIKHCGCRLALDDFGSGLSSFKYLKTLPVDYLKIDGSFVRKLADDSVDQAVVDAINQVGHIMGIQTIAEYAHSEAIVDQLRRLQVDYAQGYALGRPRPYAPT